jgi:hypothetical protein
MILGWLLGEFFHMTIWEWCKVKLKLDNKKVKTILIFVGIALVIAIVGSGFYRVTSNENIILTTLTGEKVVKDSVGIKYSLLSSREVINVQKQTLQYPLGAVGDEMITTDNKPLLVSAWLEYKITDVYKWGIDNKNSEGKLYVSFASLVKNKIQQTSYSYNRNNIVDIEEQIENEMIPVEELYGIKIININLQISDTTFVRDAKTDAEEQKINSESLKESYQSEAEALRTLYSSLDDKDFIKYMEFIKAIKEGDIEVIVVPDDTLNTIDVYNIGEN